MRLRKILNLSLWLLCMAAFFVLAGFVGTEKHKLVCQGLVISLEQTEGQGFLSREEISSTIGQLLGDSVRGRPMKEISIRMIRERLEENHYVSKAVVFATVDGFIHVEISQRIPIIRVHNLHGEQFYIAGDGRMIPVSGRYTARVIPVNGVITGRFDPSLDLVPVSDDQDEIDGRITTLQKIYLLARDLKKDPFLNAQVEQVYVSDRGEFELIPLLGSHRVIMGNADDIPGKLARLKTFYMEAMNRKGWDTYKTVNIQFKNQVICSNN